MISSSGYDTKGSKMPDCVFPVCLHLRDYFHQSIKNRSYRQWDDKSQMLARDTMSDEIVDQKDTNIDIRH